MSDFQSILPSNSTHLERAVEQLGAERFDAVTFTVSSLWNANTCPVDLLPWLAWAYSVENWDSDWSEAQKREVLRQSPAIHRKKGTRGAVAKALAALGMGASIAEWFQIDGQGRQHRVPHTFVIDVIAGDVFGAGLAVDEALHRLVVSVIQNVKPVRSQFVLRVGEARSHAFAYSVAHRARLKSKRTHVPTVGVKRTDASLGFGSGHRSRAKSVALHTPTLPAKVTSNLFAVKTCQRGRVVCRRVSNFHFEEVA